jgi:hypothetical protein
MLQTYTCAHAHMHYPIILIPHVCTRTHALSHHSHSKDSTGDDEEYYLQGGSVVWQRSTNIPLKCHWTSTGLHGIISHYMRNFKFKHLILQCMF